MQYDARYGHQNDRQQHQPQDKDRCQPAIAVIWPRNAEYVYEQICQVIEQFHLPSS